MHPADVMGLAATAFVASAGVGTKPFEIEWDFPVGYRCVEPLDVYFQSAELFDAEYQSVLGRIFDHLPPKSRVLDVGCGPGRFTRLFTRRGYDAVGIDRSADHVRLAREAGSAAIEGDVWQIKPNDFGRFDLILLFGHNLGIAGDPDGVRRLLRGLTAFAKPGTWLAVNSINKEQLTLPAVQAQHAYARGLGRYPGQMNCRLHWDGQASDWFDWIHVSEPDLTAWAGRSGWAVMEVFSRPGTPAYWSGLYQLTLS